jgi:S1-C subfamily serine protease
MPRRQQRTFSLGSGVIIDEDGYVLTNLHVVRRASRIQVKLWDDREYDAEPFVYRSEAADIALFKLKTKPGEKFRAIKFAPDDDLLLGETVLALGNPYGLGGSVTKGILSSKNRRPSTGDEPLNVEDWLQTDAAINPGNSGGPLVNLRGELIGVNVAVYREQQGERGMGVGFSVPVKQVSAALSRFLTPEITASLWFGARFKAGLPVTIASVQSGSPADKAGLKAGDQVLQINGQTPQTLVGCNRLLSESRAQKVSLLTNRSPHTNTVQLLPVADMFREKLGLTLKVNTSDLASQLGLGSGEGLIIEKVQKDSPADRAELQAGYLISKIDGQAPADLPTVTEVLSSKDKGDSVHLSLVVPKRVGGNFVTLLQGTVDVPLR